MKRMTEHELIELEIERRSLLAVVQEFSKGDQRIDSELNDLCNSLEKKAKEIQEIIIRG